MPADFFQAQEDGRARSRRFFAAFSLSAVVGLVILYLAIAACLMLAGFLLGSGKPPPLEALSRLPAEDLAEAARRSPQAALLAWALKDYPSPEEARAALGRRFTPEVFKEVIHRRFSDGELNEIIRGDNYYRPSREPAAMAEGLQKILRSAGKLPSWTKLTFSSDEMRRQDELIGTLAYNLLKNGSPNQAPAEPANRLERLIADLGFLRLNLPQAVYGYPQRLLAARPLLIVVPGLLAVMALGVFFKIRALKKGGGAHAAALLGGRLMAAPKTAAEKRLCNVVEEMTLAVGRPRPQIFILDREKTINAVSAGWKPEDSVLILTAGALEHLSRDELQAVVAHEFAHLANDDGALNLTVAGWLHALLLVDIIGRRLKTPAGFFGELGKLVVRLGFLSLATILFAALLLYVFLAISLAGLILVLSSRLGRVLAALSQAGLNRSREYLADALAVQFTRDPGALAGVLKKIAAAPDLGIIKNGEARAMEAFFFVSPLRRFSLLRAHPPLAARIKAVEDIKIAAGGTGRPRPA